MSYLVLCADFDVTTSSIRTESSTCHDPIWQDGALIDTGDYDLSVLHFMSETPHAKPFPDFSRDGMGCPVFSGRLKKLLDGHGVDNIQYFDASIIEYEDTRVQSGYYAANIVGLISAVDRESSDLRLAFGDYVLGIERLVLTSEGDALDFPIFRLEELPRVILLHQRIADVLKENNITGMNLVEPEEWDGFDGWRDGRKNGG